ncbi:branched-chain amino acid ABC transporter permease [Microbacterium sp. GXF7504]
MNYLLTLVAIFAIGIILAMSLNLVMGFAGRVSMAHAGFMGVGAYTAGWLAVNAGVDIAWGILVAAATAALIGWLFGLATIRIAGDEFILASFALQMVIVEAIRRWTDVTRGTYGMSGIPKPELFGVAFRSPPLFALYAVVVMLVCAVILMRLAGSTYGLVLRGVRESERSMEALGTDSARVKVLALTIAAAFAGVAGTLQASLVSFIHPDNFSIMLSIVIVAYLLVGGLGNMWGAALGAVLLISVPELIATTGLIPSNLLGPMEQIVYGVILMAFVWFRPTGIIAERPVVHLDRMLRRGVLQAPAAASETVLAAGNGARP